MQVLVTKPISLLAPMMLMGCSAVSEHFVAQPASIAKISRSQYQIEFVVKDANQGGERLAKEAKGVCPKGRYRVGAYETEHIPPFYSLIKATISCG